MKLGCCRSVWDGLCAWCWLCHWNAAILASLPGQRLLQFCGHKGKLVRVFLGLFNSAGSFILCVFRMWDSLNCIIHVLHRFPEPYYICLISLNFFNNHCTSENFTSCSPLAGDEANLFLSNFPLELRMWVTNKWEELKQMPEN